MRDISGMCVRRNLGESSHVVSADVWVWTVEFVDDSEALVQLRKHVRH